jgi:hypothetical protein
MSFRDQVIRHSRALGDYANGVVAQLGIVGALVGGILGLGGVLPEEVSTVALSAATAVATAGAFVKLNQRRIDRAGDDFADAVEKYWKR